MPRPEPVLEVEPEPDGFPAWALSSVMQFLGPFVSGAGQEAIDGIHRPGRNFLQEVERNLRLPLDWRNGNESAWNSLVSRIGQEPELLVSVVDYALKNILLGTYFQNCDVVATDLNRALHESGAAWRVARIEGTINFHLERRTDAAAPLALRRITRDQTREGEHLSAAWDAAYGRNPDPSRAYAEAIKAVEEVSIPVVLPNDSSATLGKVIGTLRATPTAWRSAFTQDARLPASAATPVEVLIGMLDLLWSNQTDRHAPAVPITQAQAESAVQISLGLVETFRSGSFSTP